MYGIYAYIDPPNHPNVGIYDIHGAFGHCQTSKSHAQYVNSLFKGYLRRVIRGVYGVVISHATRSSAGQSQDWTGVGDLTYRPHQGKPSKTCFFPSKQTYGVFNCFFMGHLGHWQ